MMLKELSEAFGVSGGEGEVRDLLARAVREHVDDLRIDSLGNLIAMKKAEPMPAGVRPVRVMLAAHMDEIGLMITAIDKGGQLRFRPVGGIDARLLPAKQVEIGPEQVPGIIGSKPIHLMEHGEESHPQTIEHMTIDIGATSRETAEKRVKVGDLAVFSTRFEPLGADANARKVKGKALDDRAGCTVLVELLKGRYPVEVVAVFTVQEEVGLRGARVAAYALEPDVALVLEGTICDDLPKDKDASPVTRLGDGPAITLADRTFFAHRPLVRLLTETAQAEGLPYQFKEPAMGGTDAGAIHLSRAGVPSATVSVPCRYIHGPASVLHLDDLQHTISLMRAVLPRLARWAE